MKRIFFNGYGAMTSEKQIRSNIEYMKINNPQRDIQLSLEFINENDRNNFESNFPKYLKLKKGSGTDLNDEAYYSLGMLISGLTKSTGGTNEMGEKRIKKFIDVLKKLGYLE